jgi:phenylalanyl-tRNA synthetase beta chain
MKLSLHWLTRYIDIDESPQELDRILTDVGLEVEGFEDQRAQLEGIVTGRVLTCEKHPKADKLSICTVDTGSGKFTVICGAPNVAAGQLVPFATEGAYMHALGFRIEKKVIRNVESCGMICSAKELGLGDDHSGIMVLPGDTALGIPVADYLGSNDVLFEIGITPNRGDALSHIGVARDLAAALGRELRVPEPLTAERMEEEALAVTIETPELCPRYSAAIVRGVTVGPSPAWLRTAVESAGFRSINGVVDITNFVMMEIGQPMHAFDLDRLASPAIVVRGAAEKEPFVTLDGRSHLLPAQSILICDAEKPVALGGVMGGANSEITDATTDVLLESACFNPAAIRKTAKQVGISSESSYRFERATDPERTLWALRRAVDLLMETSGGRCTVITDAYPAPAAPSVIPLRIARVESLLGTRVEKERIISILQSLGFAIEEAGDTLSCTAPSFRSDVEREVDVIEEIARIHGYDNIPTPGRIEIYADAQYDDEAFIGELRGTALSLGMDEVVSSSLIDAAHAALGDKDAVLNVLNPVSAERPSLRGSLLPCLLEAIDRNRRVGADTMRLFEIGSIFRKLEGDGQHSERIFMGMALTGLSQSREWYGEPRPFDFFDLKGIVLSLFEKLRLDKKLRFDYDGNDSLSKYGLFVEIDGVRCGTLTEVSSHILREFGIEQPVYYAEFDIALLEQHSAGVQPRYHAPSKYPAVERDLAFLLPLEVRAGDVVETALHSGATCVTGIRILDLFRHESFGDDKKSLAITVTFQAHNRTLTEAELIAGVQSIVDAVVTRWNATLRS